VRCRPRAVAEDERKLESAVRKSQVSAKLGATQIKVQAPVCADLGASRLKCDKTAHSDKEEGTARRLPARLFTRRIVLGRVPAYGQRRPRLGWHGDSGSTTSYDRVRGM